MHYNAYSTPLCAITLCSAYPMNVSTAISNPTHNIITMDK